MQPPSCSTPFISTDSRLLWREKIVGSSYVCFEGGKGNYDTPPKNDIVAIEEDDLLFFTLAMRTIFPEWRQYDCYTHVHKEQWDSIFAAWNNLCEAEKISDMAKAVCGPVIDEWFSRENVNQLYLLGMNAKQLMQAKEKEFSLYE